MAAMTFEEYRDYDAVGLAEAIRRGDATPGELLEIAISRTEAVNDRINAVVIPMYDEARRVLSASLPPGPLRGVPFLLKDLAVQYSGARTTNGSRFFAEHVADHDSELVRRYRQAGLVIFGKTATPEFGLTTSTESTLFGPTRNPWKLSHSAGGSSGGAAAAVAAGILPAAHASDGGGSIRIPASCCGLFGLKPTRLRTPMGPDLAEGWSGMSTVHVVSRSVRDSAALLDASHGPDVGDPYSAPPPRSDYLSCVSEACGPLRIAFTAETFNGAATHPHCRAALDEAVALCADLGHHVEEARPTIDAAALGVATRTIVGANTAATFNARAAQLGRQPGADDVEPTTLQMLANAGKSSSADYAQAVRTLHSTGRMLGRFFQDWDALLTPTMATPPREIGVLSPASEDTEAYLEALLQCIGFTQLMNVCGNPAASLPLYWDGDGLPIGVQFAAPFGGEEVLLRLAAQLEEARPWRHRQPPLD